VSNHHPTKRLRDTVSDKLVAIDTMLVPLIEALWAAGYSTVGSCQDLGESIANATVERKSAYWHGYVLLEMPVEDALHLLDTIKDSPQFQDKMHWADAGAWEVSLPIMPHGFFGHDADVAPWAQIHFPNDQIGDLIKVLS
jgi:hypothetical protein